MDRNTPCSAHTEQIKTLFEKSKDLNEKIDKNSDSINKRVDGMETMREFMHSLDKNMAIQTNLMENVVNHNKQQDLKMDEFQSVIISVNSNLTKLNEGQEDLKGRVDTIEGKVEVNEAKYTIHTGEVFRDFILKVAVPVGIGGTVLAWVINYFK